MQISSEQIDFNKYEREKLKLSFSMTTMHSFYVHNFMNDNGITLRISKEKTDLQQYMHNKRN